MPPRWRRPNRAAGEADEGSGSEEGGLPKERGHTGVNPTMMNCSFGDSASHPLGWSGTGPRRESATDAAPEPKEAPGWMSAPEGAYAEFLAAAAAVPEALPRPVALHQDLRVVLNLPNKDAEAEVVVVCIKQEDAPQPQRRGPRAAAKAEKEAEPAATEEAQYDAAPGTITSDAPDTSGRWEVHKTLALLPTNLRERRLPGFEDLPLPSCPLPLVRGVAVELCQLRAGAAYNGLSGVVLSSCPNERGRWEVAVKVPMRVARDRLTLVGFKKPAEAPAPRDPMPPQSTGEMHLELGDEVEIQGLVSASKHNGKRGVIVQRVLPKTAGGEVPYRWRVKCLEGGSEPLLLDLKEGNLRQASTPMPAPPTESMPRLNREATTPTEIFVDSASEAGSTASMSSQSQADSEKFRTFAIAVFRQTAAERLGIRVESVSGTGFDDAARVHRIFSGGLIDKWNKEVTEMDLPDWVVQVDDVIAGLNGRRNFTTTCQEVQEATVLNLLIIRGWPFPGIDV